MKVKIISETVLNKSLTDHQVKIITQAKRRMTDPKKEKKLLIEKTRLNSEEVQILLNNWVSLIH